MKEAQVTYFDMTSDKDPEGITVETLRVAKKRADELGIDKFVIASSRGFVAKKALDLLAGRTLVFVGESREWYDKGFLKALESKKAGVIFSDEVKYGYSGDVQAAFRCLSQGSKVCPEIVMIAADRNLVPVGEEVIAIAGTGSGADTSMVMLSAKSKNFKDLKIRELVCKPR